ncbi:hypothetical protein QAD02_015226 [Eretmocerus hayati]|uniref:Uncharacterized protein n=1 Tax=Eretmocerus hayati TaxID=131215 RepID=A0ACC2P826_9HYME|nr:hypothetical protein QAD02_015226 [Eretmocerus hayati]
MENTQQRAQETTTPPIPEILLVFIAHHSRTAPAVRRSSRGHRVASELHRELMMRIIKDGKHAKATRPLLREVREPTGQRDMDRRSKERGVDQRKIIHTSRREMLRPNVLKTGNEMPTTRASGDFLGGASHTGDRNATRAAVFEDGGRKPLRRHPRDSRQNKSRHHSPYDGLHPRGSGGLSRCHYKKDSLHEPRSAPQRNSSLCVAKSRHHSPYDDLHPRGPGGLSRSYGSSNDLHEPGATASRYRNPRGSLHADESSQRPSGGLHSRGKMSTSTAAEGNLSQATASNAIHRSAGNGRKPGHRKDVHAARQAREEDTKCSIPSDPCRQRNHPSLHCIGGTRGSHANQGAA